MPPKSARSALRPYARLLGIPKRTLQSWKSRYPQRYEQACEKIARQVEQRLAREYREAAVEAVDVQRLGLQRAKERLQRDQDGQPATTAQRAAVAAGIATDKALTLEGRPTQIHADARSVEEDLRFLRSRVIEAQVVEEREQDMLPASSAGYEDQAGS